MNMSLNVLIAEDETLTSMGLKSILEGLGHKVVGTATFGEQAVRLTETLHPDLVLMDIRLSGLDGIAAAHKIQQSWPTPVIIISGFSSVTLAQQASEAGVIAYLVKPVTQMELEPAITVAISRYQDITELRKSVTEARADLKNRKTIERAKAALMKEKSMDDEQAMRYMQTKSRNTRKAMILIAEEILQEKSH